MNTNFAIAFTALALLVGAFFFGHNRGYSAATDRYAPQVATLQAKIDAALAEAEVKRKQNEEANHAADKTHRDAVARINAYYDRVLRDAKATPHLDGGSAGAPDAACRERATATAFERKCALDANHIQEFQDWIRSMPTTFKIGDPHGNP
jgi:hypothetical protein